MVSQQTLKYEFIVSILWRCNTVYMFRNAYFLFMIWVKILQIFLAAATAAESKSASVCTGAARPPNRHTTAACSGHHLTDNTGPTE